MIRRGRPGRPELVGDNASGDEDQPRQARPSHPGSPARHQAQGVQPQACPRLLQQPEQLRRPRRQNPSRLAQHAPNANQHFIITQLT
jgi:hypothetical protein